MSFLSSFYPQPVVAGTTEGTFAEGNDSRIVGALPSSTAGSGSVLASGSDTSRTLSNRFADVVNVKDFGAVGDGAANDGPAIRSAIAYAVSPSNNKAVYFPKGTYLISTTTTGASEITSGSGNAVLIENTSTTVPWNVILIGDDATITSPLYPQEYSGPPYEQFVFFAIYGFFKNISCEGINFISTSPVANNQTGTLPKSDKGRVYGFYISGQGANFWSLTARPKNVTIRDCAFRDCILGLRIDNAENVTCDACSFYYTYGYASTGTSDWAVGLGTRQIQNLKVVNCFYDGHTEPVNPTLSQFYGYNAKCADGLVLSQGGNTSNAPASIIIANNYVTHFAREGIYVGGNSPATETSHAEIGSVICNNILDGRYPTGHVPTTNWGIRFDNPNTVVSNNVCYKCSVGIFQAGNTSYGGQGQAHHSLIKNNSILLPDADSAGYIGATGIVTGGNYVNIEGNTIVGKNIGAYRQNGWIGTIPRPSYAVTETNTGDDTITVAGHPYKDGDSIRFLTVSAGSGVTTSSVYYVVEKNGDTFKIATDFYHDPATLGIVGVNIVNITADLTGNNVQGDRILLTSAIEVFGPSNVNINDSRIFVRNNIMRILDKKTNDVLCYAIQPDANNAFIEVENNIIDGFDFVLHRFGGGNLPVLLKDNRVSDSIRMTTGYAFFEAFGQPTIRQHSYRIYPTQTGWYEIPINMRYGGSFDLEVKTYGENRYGDTTAITQNGGQSTKLSISNYDESGTSTGGTNSRLTITQDHAGQYPAITKAYIRNQNGNILLYVYVNKVLTKAALTFSGGGGSGAAGYANISGGVVQSVTITNGGSNYTSAPTVSISNSNIFVWDIQGSGATFAASLSGNVVDSVSVGGSGGSGYAQPIEFSFKSDTYFGGFGALHPRYTATTPSSGMEVPFSAGFKSMTLSGGSGGTITGTGTPTVATTAPASTPEFIGQQYINTASGIAYIATGTSSSSDWKALATWNP